MIQATSVTKSFGPVNVLRGIDFQAADREVVSIVGASGAGKSTLLQILGSLSRPDTGKVIIDGIPQPEDRIRISVPPPAARIHGTRERHDSGTDSP